MFEKNNGQNQEYFFDSQSEVPQKNIEIDDPHIFELLQDPKLMFESLEVNKQKQIINHFENREILSDKKRFLGMGNDGFVVSLDDPSHGLTCIKYVWDRLDIYPGPGSTLGHLPPEISTLHKISQKFKEIRAITRENLIKTNQVAIPTNTPEREAVFQEIARKILLEEGLQCYVPEVLQVSFFEEIEDESEENPQPLYFLDEKYTTIAMENVHGLSVQDMILNYPDSQEYLSSFDLDQIESDINKAIKALHAHKIKHQDITIRNIMLDLKQKKPVIIDFGKACYGMSSVSEEDEIKNIKEVMNHLRVFFRDPEAKRDALIEEFRKKALKYNI